MKHLISLSILFILLQNNLFSQVDYSSHFFGVNPSVTVEPYYEKGELDVNIFPWVYQYSLSKRVDIRLNSICNLGVRNDGNKISHYGLETGFPIFLKSKENKKESSKGFFVAPIVSLTRNQIEAHNNVGLWVEPGYNLLFDNHLAMSFGLQLGTTYFDYDTGRTSWGNHFGFKFIFGKWI